MRLSSSEHRLSTQTHIKKLANMAAVAFVHIRKIFRSQTFQKAHFGFQFFHQRNIRVNNISRLNCNQLGFAKAEDGDARNVLTVKSRLWYVRHIRGKISVFLPLRALFITECHIPYGIKDNNDLMCIQPGGVIDHCNVIGGHAEWPRSTAT